MAKGISPAAERLHHVRQNQEQALLFAERRKAALEAGAICRKCQHWTAGWCKVKVKRIEGFKYCERFLNDSQKTEAE